MTGAWTGMDGWSRDTPEGLAEAIAELPGGGALAPERLEGFALRIADAALDGRNLDLPGNRPASAEATDASLVKLHDLCGRLAAHLDTLRRPAVEALAREGSKVWTLEAVVRELQRAADAARCAYGDTDAPAVKRGRDKNVEATEVTAACADVFERVAGRRPTFTRDPATGEARGAFLDFLGAAFRACYVAASPEAQAAALIKKMGSEKAD